MKYAVFDWDNTLRKGFTLFAWMDFLYTEKVLDAGVRRKMGRVQKRYADKEITTTNMLNLPVSYTLKK